MAVDKNKEMQCLFTGVGATGLIGVVRKAGAERDNKGKYKE